MMEAQSFKFRLVDGWTERRRDGLMSVAREVPRVAASMGSDGSGEGATERKGGSVTGDARAQPRSD